MKDIVEFDPTQNTVEQNILTHRNIISPFSTIENIKMENTDGKLFVDTNYGLVYDDYYLHGETAIYGRTDMLPEYSGDRLANYGFLRVPFRKIPRVLVNNKQELLEIISSIKSNDDNLVLLYRGQFAEYTIERDKSTLTTLYGSSDIIEPSLITSAVRKNLKLEEILPSWMGILNLYIETILSRVDAASYHKIEKEIRNFQANSNFNGFALAMAQHYGLPSVGLDVTSDINIALFFALKKFTHTGNGNQYKYVDIKEAMPTDPPVIYLIAPAEAQQLDYNDFRPSIIPFLRPDMQSARFMHTGWGLNRNFAATRVFLAIYLNPEGDFGEIKEPFDLFPTTDSFAELLNFFKTNQIHPDEILADFLESFYVVSR